MGFNDATRREIQMLPQQSMSAAGGNTIRADLPRVGIVSHIYLAIRGSIVNGTAASTLPNPLGICSLLRNVRVTANNGNDIFNMSGVGYNYLLRPILDVGSDPLPQNNGRTSPALTLSTTQPFNLDMIIPIAINKRDPIGLIMLQSDQTLLTLNVTFESVANVVTLNGTGGSVNCTVTPYVVFYTVPANQADWPVFNLLHQIVEDTQQISANGTFTYNWPRGDIYIQTVHGFGIGVAPADNFSQVQLKMQQTTYLQSTDNPFLDIENNWNMIGQQRILGTIPFNLMGSSGLGVYDLTRDTIDSAQLTDLATVVTATASGTFYTMRRQLVPLQPAAAVSGA